MAVSFGERFRLWVDADNLPFAIRGIIFKVSKRLKFPVYFVANCKQRLPSSPLFFSVVVEPKADAADNYIALHAAKEDLVLTKDILLAGRLLDSGITVINDRGLVFTKERVEHMSEERQWALTLSKASYSRPQKQHPSKNERRGLSAENVHAFSVCLEQVLSQKLHEFNKTMMT